MRYGELKTELYSKMTPDSEDYYHYEVVTRWQPAVIGGNTEWQHFIYHIQPDGTRILYDKWDAWLRMDYADERLAQFQYAGTHPVSINSRINEQHAEIVRWFQG